MFEPARFHPARHPHRVQPKSRVRRAIEAHAKREQEAEEAHKRQLRAEKAKEDETEINRKLESQDVEDGYLSTARYGAWKVRRDVDGGEEKDGDREWKKIVMGPGGAVCYCSLFSMLVVVSMIWMKWI
jgi:hypothetical protein